MSQKEFHGAFVFRNEGNGNLSSSYFNNAEPTPYPETAKIQSPIDDADPFVGEFETVWLQKDEHYKMKLVIEKSGEHGYKLTWYDLQKPTETNHEGIGIIEKGSLVGCYWGFPRK